MTDTNKCQLTTEEYFILIAALEVLVDNKLFDKESLPKIKQLAKKVSKVAVYTANTSEEM